MAGKALGIIISRFLNALGWIFCFLPWKIQRALGAGIGLIFRALGIRAKVIRENLALAYPGNESSVQKRRELIFRQTYTHIGNLVLEILMVMGPGCAIRRFVKKKSTTIGRENWLQASAEGKGVILLASHVGNWEIMAAISGMIGIDILIVTKRLKPAWLHEAIETGRRECGTKGTYEPRTLKDILSQLKAGKTVGIVLDQYAGPPVGIRVPFFGVPVGTGSAVAAIAKRTGAPVLPVVNYRTPEGRVVIEIGKPISWKPHSDANYELALNTAAYVASIESDIRKHPDQWLWSHRRFKGDLAPLREDEWMSGRERSQK